MPAALAALTEQRPEPSAAPKPEPPGVIRGAVRGVVRGEAAGPPYAHGATAKCLPPADAAGRCGAVRSDRSTRRESAGTGWPGGPRGPRGLRALACLLAVLAVALGAGCAPAPAAGTGSPAGTPAALQTLLDRWRAHAGVPAATLTVLSPGAGPAGSWAGASGTTERGGGTPLRADAPFRVASVAKTLVATVVLQLVQDGRIRLDDPLARYLPDAPDADRVTIRQLLNHTSGIPDYSMTAGIGERLLGDRDRRWSTGDVLALVAGRRREAAPGERYAYSNTNYVLLGEVIQAVTGATWADEVRRRVIEPLGLRGTFVAGAEPGRVTPVAGYFDADNDGDTENVWDRPWTSLETSEGAAGAVVSTGPDLARFATALFGGELLAPPTLAAMVAEGPHHPRFSNYGLGVEISRPDYETTVWGHGGALPGFRSAMWYLPERRVAVVALANEWRSNPGDLAELAMRQLAGGAAGTK